MFMHVVAKRFTWMQAYIISITTFTFQPYATKLNSSEKLFRSTKRNNYEMDKRIYLRDG